MGALPQPASLARAVQLGGASTRRASLLADDAMDTVLEAAENASKQADNTLPPNFGAPKVVEPPAAPQTNLQAANEELQSLLLQDYCFAPETLIATPEGPREIGQIRQGNIVLAYSHATGSWSPRRVEKFHDCIYEGPLVTIHTSSGQVRATIYHPFWVLAGRELDERTTPHELDEQEDQGLALPGRWVNSHELRCGDVLVGQDGVQRVVLKIEQEYVSAFLVHNLTIEGDHTFAVGADALLVHNTGGCAPIRIRNAHLAGKVHPRTGIAFDDQGFPDFSSVATHSVSIQQIGNYTSDFTHANKAANLLETPAGYTWHHHQDGTTMQLVPTLIHRLTGHTGGVGLR